MNIIFNSAPDKSRTYSGIKAKMPENKIINAGIGELLTVRDFKYRKSGSSLAFDIYKLPDFLSKSIFKLSKALISDDNQRRIYSNGYYETLRFLKSAAKAVK